MDGIVQAGLMAGYTTSRERVSGMSEFNVNRYQPIFNWSKWTVCRLCSVTQSCLTLLWPHGLYSLRVFFVYGILQVRILECVAISSYRGPSWPMNQTHVSYVSCIAGGFFTAEPLGKPKTIKMQLFMHMSVDLNSHVPYSVSSGTQF